MDFWERLFERAPRRESNPTEVAENSGRLPSEFRDSNWSVCPRCGGSRIRIWDGYSANSYGQTATCEDCGNSEVVWSTVY